MMILFIIMNTISMYTRMKLLVDMISTGRSEALSNDVFIFGTKRKFFCFHLQRISRNGTIVERNKTILYAQLVLKNNDGQFYACYFGSCVLNAVDFIKGLSQQSSTMLASNVGEYILLYFKRSS